jgi:hypothetical protein
MIGSKMMALMLLDTRIMEFAAKIRPKAMSDEKATDQSNRQAFLSSSLENAPHPDLSLILQLEITNNEIFGLRLLIKRKRSPFLFHYRSINRPLQCIPAHEQCLSPP